MEVETKAIKIINNKQVMPKTPIKIHIEYNEALTLKELSEVLDRINKAINDVNRENGIKNNAKLGKEYAAEVIGVDSGSIVLNILTNFVVPIALNVFSNYLYDRLKKIGTKKENSSLKESLGYPISISVNGNDNLIELNIAKHNNN